MLDNKLPHGLTLEKFKSKNLHNTIKKYSHLAKNVEFYNSSWVSGSVCPVRWPNHNQYFAFLKLVF